MGLFDILTGRPDRMIPGGGLFGRGGGGRSLLTPITVGVLGLLAYKAIQSVNKPTGAGPSGASASGASASGAGAGGGLGDWLQRTFGGGVSAAPGNPSAGGILSGGIGDLVGQFRQSGQGDVAKSWVGTGANQPITPDTLAKVLSEEQITTLMAHTGLSREELLRGMSQELPHVVDKLTPEGVVPSPQQMDRVIDNRLA